MAFNEGVAGLSAGVQIAETPECWNIEFQLDYILHKILVPK